MSEEMLVCYCSPTLAGLKTGSLFSCPYSSQKMIIKEIREFNQKLTQKRNPYYPGSHIRQTGVDLCLSSGKVKRRFF